MLLIIEPLALVHRAVGVNEYALTIGLAVLPFTLIDITVGVRHAALAVELSILSLTVVSGAIGELNDTNTLPDTLLIERHIGLVFSLGEFLNLTVSISLAHGLCLLDRVGETLEFPLALVRLAGGGLVAELVGSLRLRIIVVLDGLEGVNPLKVLATLLGVHESIELLSVN